VAQAIASHLTLIKIDTGAIRDAVAGDVISFKGIPYAAPPVGTLRRRMLQPPKPWAGELA
jgi:para-nitrobenzyl esterase